MYFSDHLEEFAMLFVLKTKFVPSWIQELFINSSATSTMIFMLVKQNAINICDNKNIWKANFNLKALKI